jgi:hypothetical protein
MSTTLAMLMLSTHNAMAALISPGSSHQHVALPVVAGAAPDLGRLIALRGGLATAAVNDARDHTQEYYGCFHHPPVVVEKSKKHMKTAICKESAPLWDELQKALDECVVTEESAGRLEAARKLISNHNRVMADMTNPYGLSQGHIKRLPVSALAECDAAMREVARRLIGGDESNAPSRPSSADVWFRACEFMNARLQVSYEESPGRPADMSPEAGAAFRAALSHVASFAQSSA